jgi:hypothetical protein
LFACAHEFDGEINLSLLDDDRKITIKGAVKKSMSRDHEKFEPISPSDIGRFAPREDETRAILQSGETVEAISLRLGGGWGTYFQPSSWVWIAEADSEETPPLCAGVERITAEELEPDDLILLTTHGGGDMIPPIADQILPNSKSIRDRQFQWKRALVKRIADQGSDRVISDLEALGAQRATRVNLTNWCSPRLLGMSDFENDLRAVLKLVGMNNLFKVIGEGIKQLRAAHKSAGAQLQRKLRESLAGEPIGDVFEKGFQGFGEEGGAEKTVFLVEQKGVEESVPIEWEGVLFKIEENG